MSLIPIEHSRRLRDAREAAAFVRGLREKRVSMRGCHTSDPARIAAIVEAVDVRAEHTVSWEGGALKEGSWAPLEALAASAFGYLDLRTREADLRLWPGRQYWVFLSSPSDEVRLSAAKLVRAKLTPNARTLMVELDSVEPAAPLFRAATGPALERGFIQGLTAASKPLLFPFLSTLGTRVDTVLDVPLEVATPLAETFSDTRFDWQVPGLLLIDFPEGRVHGFLKTPDVGPTHRAKWLQRIDDAFARL